ncbi:MAG: hypothetical protein Tsb0017_19460 [Geothermobacteraceae bacterium]
MAGNDQAGGTRHDNILPWGEIWTGRKPSTTARNCPALKFPSGPSPAAGFCYSEIKRNPNTEVDVMNISEPPDREARHH